MGYSHTFPHQTVLSVDDTNMLGRKDWQALEINPIINGVRVLSPATYNKPSGYLGGIGATSTIPISFQVQFGARFSF